MDAESLYTRSDQYKATIYIYHEKCVMQNRHEFLNVSQIKDSSLNQLKIEKAFIGYKIEMIRYIDLK